jgi:hypothetical protein
VTLLSLVVGIGSLKGQTSEELQQRFLNEAPHRWEEYRAKIEQFDGTVTVVMNVGSKPDFHVRFEYKHNSNCRLCLEQSLLKESPAGSLFAYNTRYGFSLARKTADQPWVVTGYNLRQDDSVTPEVRETLSRLILLRKLVRASTTDLADLVREPTFRILRALPVSHDGEDLVQIEFDNSHELALSSDKKSGKKFDPIQAGSLLLDPNRYWCVRACELRNKYINADAKIKVDVELRDLSAKFPVPKRIVESNDQTRPMGERLLVTFVTDFDLHEPLHLPPDDAFTLSAFGLPEPLGVTWSKPTRWYLWLSLAGALCLGGSGVFYWLKRRAAAKAH